MITALRWLLLGFCGVVALALGWAFFPQAVIFCAGLFVACCVVAVWQGLWGHK